MDSQLIQTNEYGFVVNVDLIALTKNVNDVNAFGGVRKEIAELGEEIGWTIFRPTKRIGQLIFEESSYLDKEKRYKATISQGTGEILTEF